MQDISQGIVHQIKQAAYEIKIIRHGGRNGELFGISRENRKNMRQAIFKWKTFPDLMKDINPQICKA